MNSNATRLRGLLTADEFVAAPGCHDGFSTMLASRYAFNAHYVSGYCIAASRYGLPDTGLIGLKEMIEGVNLVTRLSGERPVIADADTGYGGLINVRHTVREYETAGAAAIQFEDQEMPKKCGHTKNKRVISLEDMAAKVTVAAEARRDDNFVVIARTDALMTHGLDEAIRRCRAYRKAGADVVFIDALDSEDSVRRAGGELAGDGPVMINISPRGGNFMSLEFSTQELQAFGYAVAIYPLMLGYPSLAGMESASKYFLANGRVNYELEPETAHSHSLIGFPEVWDLEAGWAERFGQGAPPVASRAT